jgi:hypothetical protein
MRYCTGGTLKKWELKRILEISLYEMKIVPTGSNLSNLKYANVYLNSTNQKSTIFQLN